MRFAIIIPHYNHVGTLRRVAEGCLKKNPDVAIFDDGSAVSPAAQLAGLPVTLVRFNENRGKGAMLLEAARWAANKGITHLVTLDADGQHRHQDYPSITRLSRSCSHAIIIGKCKSIYHSFPFFTRFVQGINRLLVRVETGKKLTDLCSGYRVYPVDLLLALPLRCKRYTFETEVLVKALWAGADVREREIHTVEPKNCISHVRLLTDNLQLLLLHFYLFFCALFPSSHKRYIPRKKK